MDADPAAAGSTSELLSQGSFLRDRWEILKKIGGGGFGEIYKARDHVTNLVSCLYQGGEGMQLRIMIIQTEASATEHAHTC